MESSSTGKLELAAMENVRLTMKAMVCFSKRMPSRIDNTPSTSVVMRDTRISSLSVAVPWRSTLA
jgi:hypothetical protein